MSVSGVTSAFSVVQGASVSTAGSSGFAAAMSAATGVPGSAAGSAISNPFGQLGTDVRSLLVRLGGSASPVHDISAAAGQGHHHHGAHEKSSSGDLPTDFANSAVS